MFLDRFLKVKQASVLMFFYLQINDFKIYGINSPKNFAKIH